MAVIYSLITAVTFTVSNIFFRISAKGEKNLPALSVAYGLVSTIVCIPFIFVDGGRKFDGNINSYFIIAAIVGWSFFSYVNVWINNKMEASTQALLGQVSIVFSFVIGIFLFTGSASWMKVLGVLLIVGGTSLLFIGKAHIDTDKVFWARMILSFTLAFTYLFDNLASSHFSFGIYATITYGAPSLLVMLLAKVSIKDLIDLCKRSFLKVLMISLPGVVGYYFMIKAYKLDNISLVIPVMSTATILTVLAGAIFLGERKMILKKVVLAFLVFLGVVILGSV